MIIWFFDDSLYRVVNHENQTQTKSHHFNNDDSLFVLINLNYFYSFSNASLSSIKFIVSIFFMNG